jgi:uncharacterized protein YbaP (TraB family)
MLLIILVQITRTMMLRFRASLLCLFLFVFSAGFAQQKWPNTFLWRISGKNLTRPSYLYGTIHLQDKRLFQFSDSLYQALEKVDGFALEINFDEFMDTMFARGFRSAEDEVLERQPVKLDKRKLDKSADSLLKTLGIEEDNITKKDLKRIRDYRMNKLVQQGEMQTIVDGYLYGLALRLGKWTGGIEDVNDQLELIDEMGAGLTTDEVFQPEVNLRKSLNEMISIYLKRDLEGLANYVDGKYAPGFRDKVLTQRNLKMARRMDSLAALRTMFFGVGVAHLPGDSGVINLLRKRGFIVEPVHSPQSLSPETYSSKLKAIPWKTIKDDPLYSVEMPGAPSAQNIFGEAAKMKVFFDLSTMTFYMAGHTIGGNNNSVILDDAFNRMAERMGSTSSKIQTKEIAAGNDRGREGIFDVAGASFKVRLIQQKNVMYMLLVVTTKKSNLNTPDVTKFFSSFVANDVIANEKKWADFTIPGKAFSVQLPGHPKPNKRVNEAANGSNWEFTTYDLVDDETGYYYLVQVRDLKPGYFLEGDTTYYSVSKENYADKFDKIISEEQFKFNGFPAFKMMVSDQNGLMFKFLTVVRGNRVYNIIVGGGTKSSDFSDVDRVFNSLKFEDYNVSPWKKYSFQGFTTTASAAFIKMEKDTTSDVENESEHFVSYNSSDVNSYEIFKRPLSPYYWTNNDSSFFAEKLHLYTDYADSVIERNTINAGKLKGVEYVLQKPGSNTLKRIRSFVNGDTLYTILAFVPIQHSTNEYYKKFFEDFRVANEIQPTIYTKKSKQLLESLRSKDTTAFAKALDVLEKVKFDKEDLPLLHQALLFNYIKREDDYTTVNERIIGELKEIADSSTVQFIAENYPQLGKQKDSIKYFLLEMLSKIKTTGSYSLLKKLLLTDLPLEGDAGNLSYPLLDSLELTAKLYPEILSLSKDSIFSGVLVKVTDELLDSNLVSMHDVLPYKQNFLSNAKKSLEAVKEDEDNWWMHRSWVPFIGKFNDKESNDIVAAFLKLSDIDIKYTAILALLKNSQPVSPSVIEKVAENKNYRKDLYEELKKMNKQKLYPAKYATQLKIAESEIHILASDDDEPSSVTFIGERITMFMGKKQKFYLFKVSFEGEDYSSSYLGITGPYALTNQGIVTSSDASGCYWDEEYDKKKIEEHFMKHLSDTEKYLGEKEQGASSIIK